jgi:hypothetical protein
VIIARRRPRDIAGLLLTLVGLTEALTSSRDQRREILSFTPVHHRQRVRVEQLGNAGLDRCQSAPSPGLGFVAN